MRTILLILLVFITSIGCSQTNIQSTKYISKLSDFPAQSGGVRTLEANTNYIINGQIVLDYPLVLSDGSALRGASTSFCRLTWTGDSAMLRGTDNSSVIRGLQLVATGGTNTCVFDFENLARDKNITLLDNYYIQCDSIGGVKGYNLATFLTSAYLNNIQGLVIDSCYSFAFSSNYMQSSEGNAGNFLTLPDNAIYDAVSITNNIFDAENATDTIIWIGNINTTFATISSNTFKKSMGKSIYGVDENIHPEIKLYSNNNIDNYIILPHYTSAYISGIPAPNKGSMVWNEDNNEINVYSGTSWYKIASSIIYTTDFEETFEKRFICYKWLDYCTKWN